MGEVRKIRIGSIDGPFREAVKYTEKGSEWLNDYNWDELKDSFDKYGYDTDKFGYITVIGMTGVGDNNGRYEVRDGNHRLHLLREKFGEEHFVSVKYVNVYTIPLRCGWCDKVKNLTKKTSGKLELANIIIMSTCFLLLYLKPTLIFMGFILGILIISVTGIFDIKKETYNKHSLKFGGITGTLINVVKNIPIIAIVISSIYYLWHLININPYTFMIIIGFTLIMGYLISYYEKKEKNDR